jgi:glycerol-3-phosphate acyltransferase PlsY
MTIVGDVLLLLFCYLLGAIPTGLIVGKKLFNKDIREHGSKNIGATNAFRVLGWKAGLSVFAIDVGKAFGAVFFAEKISPNHGIGFIVLCGIAVLLGNFFNVFLGWKGGKGVATSLGVFLALAPKAVIIAFLLFLVLLAITRYVSIGSIAAALSMPVLTFYFYGTGWLLVMMIAIAALIIFKHRANIVRLVNGRENKIGKKKAA